MIPSYPHWSRKAAVGNHAVNGLSEPCPFAEAKPTHPCGQTLKLHMFPGFHYPAAQLLVVSKVFQKHIVQLVDVVLAAYERCPTEGALAFAKQRPDVSLHEAWKSKSLFEPCPFSLFPQVVSIIKRYRAFTHHL